MNRPTLARRGALVAAAVLCLAAAGCASGPEVRSEFDRNVDFTQYKTFGFVAPLGTDRTGYQSIVSQYLMAATEREMAARGVRLATTAPQLLVNFNAALDEKLRVTTVPGPSMGLGVGRGYYGYRGGLYSTWPMYRDETIVTPYQEGTLNIDVVDAARKQMVWEGVVRGTVTQKAIDNLQASIDAAVAAAFAKYPVPGSAMPK